MTNYQLNLLKACRNGLPAINRPANETEAVMWLSSQGLCELCGRTLDSTTYVLTSAGKAYLELLEQAEHDKTEAEREYREQCTKADKDRKKKVQHEWLIAIFNFFLGIISGLIVEHFFDILVILFPELQG